MGSKFLPSLAPIFFLIALSCLNSVASADVPREAIDRLADITVQKREIRHLNAVTKITDQEYSARSKALATEERTLWEPWRRIPADQKQAALSAIQGQSRSRLSVLEPRWQTEQAAFRKESGKQKQQTALAVEENARQAAEFQRQRISLQQQLDRGTIDRETFNIKDRKALAGITALRNKQETGQWGRRFDERLALFTKALADNPDTDLPRSQVQPAGEGDFNKDVKIAADIVITNEENDYRFNKKQITPDTYREAAKVYGDDLNGLRARYDALKKGREFEAAYTRSAAAGIQALKLKYYPERFQTAAPQTGAGSSTWEWAWPSGLAIAVIAIFAYLIFLVFHAANEPDPPPKEPEAMPPLTDNYGSAAWEALQRQPTGADTVSRGVFFGRSSHPDIAETTPGAPITSQPESHTLIVAQTGAGKGTRVIIPTLLRYASSMLVIDPKGENAAITARTRRDQLNHKIHIVNPWGEMQTVYDALGFTTATFNPLDAIEVNDPNAVAVAQTLAAAICPKPQGKDNPFWQGSAANILAAVFLWLADQDGFPRTDEPTQKQTKTLARARELVTQSKAMFLKDLVKMASAKKAFNGAIPEFISQYLDLGTETYSGILATLAENTKFLSDPQVKTSTAASSFSLDNIRDQLMTIYIVIPYDRLETQSTWLKLVIASAMQALKRRGRNNTPPRHRCMFLIDEFGSIGHIAAIPRDIALMRGFGLDFTLVIQDLNQLKDHYGEAKGTILNNCANKWFCHIGDLETAKYLSESLGKKTVRTTGKSKSDSKTEERETEGESTTYGETGRALLTPDEIMKAGKTFAVLLPPSGLPRYLRPVDYWRLSDTFSHLQGRHPKFYWQPPLSYDPNPLRNNQTSPSDNSDYLKSVMPKFPTFPAKKS